MPHMTRRWSAEAAARVQRTVEHLCGAGLPAAELLPRLKKLVRRVVPFDGSLWVATDPAPPNLLPVAGLADGLPAPFRRRLVERDLDDPEGDRFVDVARRARPVATLAATDLTTPTGALYRNALRDLGAVDELRTAFVSGGVCWGVASLMRRSAPFTTAESVFVAALSPHVAAGLRAATTLVGIPPAIAAGQPGVGVVLLDETGTVESASPAAEHWLDELTKLDAGDARSELPEQVAVLATHSRAAITDGQHLRVRIRTPTGWLSAHAERLPGRNGRHARTAVVITPARPADLTPLLIASYGLSPRESDVAALLAQGFATSEIAAHCHLSAHTVRDYVKNIFHKTGVNSRREIVARMFADLEYLRQDE